MLGIFSLPFKLLASQKRLCCMQLDLILPVALWSWGRLSL